MVNSGDLQQMEVLVRELKAKEADEASAVHKKAQADEALELAKEAAKAAGVAASDAKGATAEAMKNLQKLVSSYK